MRPPTVLAAHSFTLVCRRGVRINESSYRRRRFTSVHVGDLLCGTAADSSPASVGWDPVGQAVGPSIDNGIAPPPVRALSAGAPLLTVLLPVYNGLPFLAQAVRSIMAQSFRDWEMICLDDGSTDGSLARTCILHCFSSWGARVCVCVCTCCVGRGSAFALQFGVRRGAARRVMPRLKVLEQCCNIASVICAMCVLGVAFAWAGSAAAACHDGRTVTCDQVTRHSVM